MAMTDLVSDFLTRIRNGSVAGHERVEIMASRINANIAKILKEEGFIKQFRLVQSDNGKYSLRVYLKYDETGEPVLRGLKRESRPGLRKYVKHDSIPQILSGMGTSILSTSRGVLSAKECKKRKVGGELICSVW